MLKRAGLDGRFFLLMIGTIVLSGIIVLAVNAAHWWISNGQEPDGVGETLVATIFIIVVFVGVLGGFMFVCAIGPAAVVWAIYWELGRLAGLSVRLRAMICACLTVLLTSMFLVMFLAAFGRSFGPLPFFLLWAILFGGPVALVVGPALAAIIYRERSIAAQTRSEPIRQEATRPVRDLN